MRPNWFIALPVPARDVGERLGAPPPGVRLIHPDDVHLTLAFLGAVDEEKARAAWAERRLLAPLGPAQPVSFGRVVGLGNPRHPSALSAHVVAGEAELCDAIARVRDAMHDAAGVARERRAPLPHITLAHIRRSATAGERKNALAWADALDLGGLAAVVERVALFTWSENRSERQFRAVELDVLPGDQPA